VGEKIQIKVRGTWIYGVGPWVQEASTVTIKDVPGNMYMPILKTLPSPYEYKMHWAAPSTLVGKGNSKILGYNFQQRLLSGYWIDVTAQTASTNWEIKDSKPDSTYNFRVRARNMYGWGLFSDLSAVKIPG
jgi:hypothetical protein